MVDILRLRCSRGPLNSEVYELDPSFRYILGREPDLEGENVQKIELPSRTASRNHAEIFYDGSSWVIQDLKSYNGIRVNKTKVLEAYLSPGFILDIGEFSFHCEGNELEQTSIELKDEHLSSPSSPSSPGSFASSPQKKLIQRFNDLKEKFESLEFRYKLLVVLVGFVLLSYALIRVPLMIEVEKSLLDQTYSYAIQTSISLGEKNKRELADRSFYLLDCDYLRASSVVRSASLWDRQGNMVCPVGEKREADYLIKLAQERQELVSDCDSSTGVDKARACSSIFPVKVWTEQNASFSSVGFARIDYFPSDVVSDVEKLRGLLLKSFFVVLLLIGLVWWAIQFWVRKAAGELVDEVHLLFTGTAQNVEHLESFAAFNGLVNEINHLFSKLNQEFKSESSSSPVEASFLQNLLQQVFLLEERAVLAVDSENHVIAMTSSVPEFLPVLPEAINLHVSDAVADTHLQGELMSFLNELSTSNEVLDRPLSLSDRVIQAQGMPLYFRDEHVATIVLF